MPHHVTMPSLGFVEASLAFAFDHETVIRQKSAVVTGEQAGERGFFFAAKFALVADDAFKATVCPRQLDKLGKRERRIFLAHC